MRGITKIVGSILSVVAFAFVVGQVSAQLNPGFELAGPTANGATNWNTLAASGGAFALATRTNLTPHAGSFDLYLEGIGSPGAPNIDVRSDFIPVTFGTSYNFSFWAKNTLKLGGANPQWDIFWYDAANLPVGAPTFVSFSSVGSSYTLVTNAITITPPSALAVKATVGWIQAVGAGVGDHWITQIDDVSFTAVPEPTTLSLVGLGVIGLLGLRRRKA
jgi:hypothetical protein